MAVARGHRGRDTDSGWAWLVCLSSFLVMFVVPGLLNSFGVLFVALLQEFRRSEAETGELCPIEHFLSSEFLFCSLYIFVSSLYPIDIYRLCFATRFLYRTGNFLSAKFFQPELAKKKNFEAKLVTTKTSSFCITMSNVCVRLYKNNLMETNAGSLSVEEDGRLQGACCYSVYLDVIADHPITVQVWPVVKRQKAGV